MSCGRALLCILAFVLLGLVLVSCAARAAETTTPSPTAPPFSSPHPILFDLRVRRGIAHCTDRAGLIRSVYPYLEDTDTLEMDSFLPSSHWAYPARESSFSRYPFDPEKGKALFEQAGWSLAAGATYRANASREEMSLTLTSTQAQFRQTWLAVFEEQMKTCGLRIIRNHLPAEQFFENDLPQRNFELAAFAQVHTTEPSLSPYLCEQITLPVNDWQGLNYSGWCNHTVDEAAQAAAASLERAARRELLWTIQEEYSHDLPFLTLFTRLEYSVTQPALENFMPPGGNAPFTWNAAQWLIPDKDTILIGERSEPAGLWPWEDCYVCQVVGALVFGLDYVELDYEYQPIMLKRIPSIENGAVAVNPVQVKEGEAVVDVDGYAVTLAPGMRIRDAHGNIVTFQGDAVEMRQLTVRFEYVEGLTWSDGAPVSSADYEVAFRFRCSPETGASEYILPPATCDKIAAVDFVSDTTYVVTWKPGYQDKCQPYYQDIPYFLPPIGRMPAHQIVADGRRVADLQPSEWYWLADMMATPLGVGPYFIREWVYGERMALTANPYYFLGPPATPTIIIRFIPQKDATRYFLQGSVDVLGPDSILPDQIDTLLQAQAEAKAKIFFIPSGTYEHIIFALFVK
ncbi:MAG: peptide ABC transporter substrate-binding protein [Chloroflexi bacterium]|nr:peptide ABC transporter substrate-binding protein [Chloroflexota bacterium]